MATVRFKSKTPEKFIYEKSDELLDIEVIQDTIIKFLNSTVQDILDSTAKHIPTQNHRTPLSL